MVSSSFQTENLRRGFSMESVWRYGGWAVHTAGCIWADTRASTGRTGGGCRPSLGIYLVLCVSHTFPLLSSGTLHTSRVDYGHVQSPLRPSLGVSHIGDVGGVGGDILLAGGGRREGTSSGRGLCRAQCTHCRPQRAGKGVSRGHGGRAMADQHSATRSAGSRSSRMTPSPRIAKRQALQPREQPPQEQPRARVQLLPSRPLHHLPRRPPLATHHLTSHHLPTRRIYLDHAS